MRALVTGGAGFIGSNLVDALLAAGHEVAVIDDLSTGREANLAGALAEGAQLHVGDVTDPAALDAAFAAARPEAVFHLAAQVDVRRSVADPAEDAHRNVVGAARVLEHARRHGAGRVVFSSSVAVYGDPDELPTPEHAPRRPLSPYGQAKLAAEGYVELFGRLHGMATVSLRYANVYGPRQDPLGEGGVVAIFCGHAATGARPTVFGDGGQTRDFVYVGDVVAANVLAATAGARGIFNVGTAVETPVIDLVAALGLPEPVFAPDRLGEVRRSCLDNARARSALGWAPATSLADGLRATLAAVAVPA
jgi:UDP-glucose 4-epimerase